jgi:hypothetical protein
MLTKLFLRSEETIVLSLQESRKFSRNMAFLWNTFVGLAPDEWKDDGFLASHLPTSITCRYGQNQQICQEDTLDQEADCWHSERNYEKIDFLSFALATDIQYEIPLIQLKYF